MGGKPEERVMLSGCLRQNGNVVFDECYLEARGDGGEVSVKTTPLVLHFVCARLCLHHPGGSFSEDVFMPFFPAINPDAWHRVQFQ